MSTNFRNKPASQHSFAMVPRADVPRSKYRQNQNRKQSINAGALYPIYCEEVLPGDHFKGNTTIYARFATPIKPVLDDAEIETFFFFVPNRILWDNWEDFIGGGSHLVPIINGVAGGDAVGSIFDHFGIPVAGQVRAGLTMQFNALPFRAYNLIYNEWFRDENLVPVTERPFHHDDGPDPSTDYALATRMKKHDYFTSCLPWPQKGTAVDLPLGTVAPIFTDGATNDNLVIRDGREILSTTGVGNPTYYNTTSALTENLWADLSNATAATINEIRLAFQVQRLLERDARGGTRYTELIQSHFGVRPLDYRLQRPEYIGGGRMMVNTAPIAQTSASNLTGGSTPLANLSAITTSHGGQHTFKYAATEHGYIIGLAQARCQLTYQQGLRRHWSRQTRYDFYFPAFAHLGEQAVLQKEIYATGDGTADDTVFGYQERWAEYRYTPNEICGLFRSTAASTIDIWHYSQKFTAAPTLNSTFIKDPSSATLDRSLAVSASALGNQILMDVLHSVETTRPMPTYSVPGLIDHF